MKAQIISFHCVLKNTFDEVLSTSFNQDVITRIASEAAVEIPGLSEKLQNVTTGEKRKFTLKAREAYGFYDPRLVKMVSAKSLKSRDTVALGERVSQRDAAGKQRLYRVTEIKGDVVQLDANHPLAGQDLVFEVHVVDARDATQQEISESSEPMIPHYLH